MDSPDFTKMFCPNSKVSFVDSSFFFQFIIKITNRLKGEEMVFLGENSRELNQAPEQKFLPGFIIFHFMSNIFEDLSFLALLFKHVASKVVSSIDNKAERYYQPLTMRLRTLPFVDMLHQSEAYSKVKYFIIK